MSTMENNGRKSYLFQDEAVRRFNGGRGQLVKLIAAELGVGYGTVRAWVKPYRRPGFYTRKVPLPAPKEKVVEKKRMRRIGARKSRALEKIKARLKSQGANIFI